jgi:hypothetical protein
LRGSRSAVAKLATVSVALAAAYSNLLVVVAGTTTGVLLANAPVVFLGRALCRRLPLKTIHYVASGLFLRDPLSKLSSPIPIANCLLKGPRKPSLI